MRKWRGCTEVDMPPFLRLTPPDRVNTQAPRRHHMGRGALQR